MSRKRFEFNQDVFVHFKGAAYKGIYRGVDTFDKKKPHSVKIPSMHRQLEFADADIFHSYNQLKNKHPQVESDI